MVILSSETCVCSSIKLHFCISIYFKMSVLHYLQREDTTADFKELITILPLFLYNEHFTQPKFQLHLAVRGCTSPWACVKDGIIIKVTEQLSWDKLPPRQTAATLSFIMVGVDIRTHDGCRKIIPHKACILLMWPKLGEEKRKSKQLNLSCDI